MTLTDILIFLLHIDGLKYNINTFYPFKGVQYTCINSLNSKMYLIKLHHKLVLLQLKETI